MTTARRIVFYRTLPIDDDALSGSGVRPAKLLRAFKSIGFDVDVVAGFATEREAAIVNVRRNLRSGVRYEFVYAEPPTTPLLLNERHHMPTHPILDYGFLRFLHRGGVPLVLFYSDVQWRLREYPRRIGVHKYLFALPFFHLDLAVYRRIVDVLLVPDPGMLAQIPGWPASKPALVSNPGFDPDERAPEPAPRREGSPLRLFYVGGIQPPVYDLEPLLEGVARARVEGIDLTLTLCTREAEWQRRPPEYDRFLAQHVMVVHNRTRDELLELYASHDIAVMPYGTRNSDWAMPIKFAEAIGVGLPLLAGEGTAVGRVVAGQGLGWLVGPDKDDLRRVLTGVGAAEIASKRAAVATVRPSYSWNSRAEEIATIAAGVRSTRRAVAAASPPC